MTGIQGAMKNFRKQGFFALGLAVIVLISVESIAQFFYFGNYGNLDRKSVV